MRMAAIKALSIGVLAAVWPLAASAAGPEQTFVSRLNDSIGKAASGRTPADAAQALCADVANWALDFDAMAPVASAGAWTRMASGDRKAYRVAFQRRLVRDCAGQARSALSRPVELLGARAAENGELILATRAAGDLLAKPLVWRGRVDAAGAFRVTDVLVDGRSAVLAVRDEASAALALSGGDVAALLRSMQR